MSRWHKNDADLLPEDAFKPLFGRRGPMRLHGGKDNGAPPPDPRLIEAQIRSMGIQDDAIKGIMDLSREMQPLQREQLQFGLDSARSAFEQSQADREYGLGRRAALTGLQDRLVSDARSFSAEDRGNQLAGQAIGDVRQAFATTRDASARQLARMGVNPSDGKFAAMASQAGIAEALGQAQASTAARDSARKEGYALTDRATNALAGYPAFGLQTTGQGAQFAASGINLANQGQAGLMAGNQSAAQMAGQMGQNATNMFGAQASYKIGADKAAADANPMGALLGAGATLGAAAIRWSDRRLKQDIELVGRDERTGLNLYEYAYRTKPTLRWRGVMADEVMQVMPEAVHTGDRGFMSVDYGALGLELKQVGETP